MTLLKFDTGASRTQFYVVTATSTLTRHFITFRNQKLQEKKPIERPEHICDDDDDDGINYFKWVVLGHCQYLDSGGQAH